MSVARMLVAGVLVAGGVVLGTFTAAGYLEPDWTQKQAAAAAQRGPATAPVPADPKFASAFRRTRFVAETVEQAPPSAVKLPVAPASVKPQPRPVDARAVDAKAAEPRSATKSPVRKKIADKAKEKPKAQQTASSGFPWNLFGN